MAERGAAEPRKVGPERDPPHHLRPRPCRDGRSGVAVRLREEEWPPYATEFSAAGEVRDQQLPCGGGGRDHPRWPRLGRPRPNRNRPPGRVQIAGGQEAQLLAAQPGVVGEGEHEPVANALLRGHLEKTKPLLLAGDPREAAESRHKTASPLASEGTSWRVATATNGVVVAHSLLDEEIVEEPDARKPLLDRGVGQSAARVEDDDVIPACPPPLAQSVHPVRDSGPIGSDGIDSKPITCLDEVGETSGVCRQRSWRQSEVRLDPEPGGDVLAASERWPMGEFEDVCNGHSAPSSGPVH